jgi:hypothetical protein
MHASENLHGIWEQAQRKKGFQEMKKHGQLAPHPSRKLDTFPQGGRIWMVGQTEYPTVEHKGSSFGVGCL